MLNFRKKEAEYFGQAVVLVEGRLELLPIEEESEGKIKCGEMVLPVTSGTEYFSRSGDRFMVFNLSLPALVEAETVGKIRESEVLRGLFDAPVEKKFLDYLPLIVLGLVAILTLLIRR